MNRRSDNSAAPPPEPGHDRSDQAAAWFARLRSGHASAEERAAFDSWIRRHPTHEQAFQELGALWEDPDLLQAAVEIDETAPRAVPAGPWHRLWPRIVAGAAVLLLISAVALFQWDVPLRLRSDYVTAAGERHTLLLADRSTVILNTRSAVATSYKADIRHVTLLKGEALFRVEPDKSRRFIVEYQGVVTQAVGTSFLIREKQDGLHITVLEGVVQVRSDSRAGSAISLTAGQQARVAPNGTTSIHSVNPDAASAWVQGRLVFDSMPFSEVLEEIARYHSGYVGLWNPVLATLRVSGSYNLTDTAHILTTLTQTLPVHMTRLTDRFVVFH
jgi:transmembrane sensor